jgi:hypothetical protein
MPTPVRVLQHKNARMDEVYSFSTHWPHLYPQHGPGVKHERRIALEPWQQRIVERYPGRLLRGLVLSALLLLQPLARHPADLLRGLRPARYRLAAGRAVERLGGPPRGGWGHGQTRRPQAVRGN